MEEPIAGRIEGPSSIRSRPGSATATSFPRAWSSSTRSRRRRRRFLVRSQGPRQDRCHQDGQARKPTGARAASITHNEWRTADGIKIMDETRTLRLPRLRQGPPDRARHRPARQRAARSPSATPRKAPWASASTTRSAATRNGKIENAEGKIGEKECWGQTLRLVRLLRPDRRQDGRPGHPGRSEEPVPDLLAQPGLRPDGRQSLRPERAAFPAMKGKTDLVDSPRASTCSCATACWSTTATCANGQRGAMLLSTICEATGE